MIRVAESDEDIRRCFSVMQQLRTHLVESEFVSTIRRQMASGYHDLVTDSAERSKGCGQRLLKWLVERAHAEACHTLELDSGVQRFEAHRFYLTNRMVISSHYFRLTLETGVP